MKNVANWETVNYDRMELNIGKRSSITKTGRTMFVIQDCRVIELTPAEYKVLMTDLEA